MRTVSKLTTVLFTLAGLMIAGKVPGSAQSGNRNYPPAGSATKAIEPSSGSTSRMAPLALEGYCPVSLHTVYKWVKGDPSIRTVFDGHTYYFANEQGKQMFLAAPEKYVPALGGDCVVSLVKTGKRVPGNIRYAVFHDGRLFLCANADAKSTFLADPSGYVDADLAYGGYCVVCRVGMQQMVRGRPEFMVIHKGLRYLFASAAQRDEFLANPSKYEAIGTSSANAPAGSTTRPVLTPGPSSPNPGSGSGSR
ncbi:hypothetical protein [Thermogutta sp.]|uniref:hypothetical protein n=1 Tax=Thermogutta sp. TaxID=1962930 RepID=UPI003C7A4C66